MSLEQYQAVLARLSALENTVNDTLVAIDNLASKSLARQLLAVIQQDLANTKAVVESLTARVTALEEEPLE